MASFSFRVGSIDVAPYINVDQMNTGFSGDGSSLEAQWADTPVGDGSTLTSVNAKSREISLPLLLKAGDKNALFELIESINNELKKPHTMVAWKDEGSSTYTYYDLKWGKLSYQYNFFRSRYNYLSATLQLWVGAFGHSGTLRIVGTSTAISVYTGARIFKQVVGDPYFATASTAHYQVTGTATCTIVQDSDQGRAVRCANVRVPSGIAAGLSVRTSDLDSAGTHLLQFAARGASGCEPLELRLDSQSGAVLATQLLTPDWQTYTVQWNATSTASEALHFGLPSTHAGTGDYYLTHVKAWSEDALPQGDAPPQLTVDVAIGTVADLYGRLIGVSVTPDRDFNGFFDGNTSTGITLSYPNATLLYDSTARAGYYWGFPYRGDTPQKLAQVNLLPASRYTGRMRLIGVAAQDSRNGVSLFATDHVGIPMGGTQGLKPAVGYQIVDLGVAEFPDAAPLGSAQPTAYTISIYGGLTQNPSGAASSALSSASYPIMLGNLFVMPEDSSMLIIDEVNKGGSAIVRDDFNRKGALINSSDDLGNRWAQSAITGANELSNYVQCADWITGGILYPGNLGGSYGWWSAVSSVKPQSDMYITSLYSHTQVSNPTYQSYYVGKQIDASNAIQVGVLMTGPTNSVRLQYLNAGAYTTAQEIFLPWILGAFKLELTMVGGAATAIVTYPATLTQVNGSVAYRAVMGASHSVVSRPGQPFMQAKVRSYSPYEDSWVHNFEAYNAATVTIQPYDVYQIDQINNQVWRRGATSMIDSGAPRRPKVRGSLGTVPLGPFDVKVFSLVLGPSPAPYDNSYTTVTRIRERHQFGR